MKVTIIESGRIAINPRSTINLIEGETLAVGDKGITQVNIERIIELGYGEESSQESEIAETIIEDVISTADPIDSFDNKDDLETFAKETYDIELDKRKSLSKMKKDLKSQIEGNV